MQTENSNALTFYCLTEISKSYFLGLHHGGSFFNAFSGIKIKSIKSKFPLVYHLSVFWAITSAHLVSRGTVSQIPYIFGRHKCHNFCPPNILQICPLLKNIYGRNRQKNSKIIIIETIVTNSYYQNVEKVHPVENIYNRSEGTFID